MTRSRASLVACSSGAVTRISRAAASVPQRWTVQGPARDGWTEVVHQLVGDGLFGGDLATTSISAGPGAHLLVRGVAATPLRAGRRSTAAARIRVAPGASLISAPGALIPHAGSDHAGALRLDVARHGRALVISIITPGRTGMGERGRFDRLRLRTVARAGPGLDGLCLFEDATIEPGADGFDTPALWAGAAAAISVTAIGDWGGPALFEGLNVPGLAGGCGALRTGGFAYRGLAATLGAAQDAVEALISAARAHRDCR